MAHRRLFVGRDAELAQLHALLLSASQGAGRAAVVEGEAGLGKTRLVEECIVLAEQQEFRVLRAAGEELDRERPFGLLVDALQLSKSAPDAERARIAGLLLGDPRTAPESPPLSQAADLRFHLVESLCDLIERAATAGPLAIVAEDIHWADPSSLLTLYRLSRRSTYLPLLLLLTCRPTPRSAELERLITRLMASGALALRLAPLPPAAVTELLEQLLGASAGPALKRNIAGAAGNPLFVTELVDALTEAAAISIDRGVAELQRHVEMPPSLRMTVLRRMSSLSPPALQTMRMASILGESFSFQDLLGFTGSTASELAPYIEEATRAGFVVDAGERLAFRHDIVREALYLELSGPVRKGLHAQAGRALAAAGASARQVAAQLALGASRGEHEAVAWLHRAARELAPRVPAAAVELLERAIELLEPGDQTLDQLVADLMIPLVWCARFEEAEAHARALLARTSDPAVSLATYRGLFTVLYLQQRMPALRTLCEEVLAKPWLSPADRVFFQGLSTLPLLALGRVEEALARATAALAGGSELGVSSSRLLGLWAPIQVAILEGRYRQAVEQTAAYDDVVRQLLLEERQSASSISLSRVRIGFAYLIRAWSYIAADRFYEALPALQEARRNYEMTSAPPYINLCHRGLANAYYLTGQWDDALAEVQAARLLAEETGIHGLRSYQGDPTPLIHLHRGALREAEQDLLLIDQALGLDRPPVADLWYLPLHGLVAEARGDVQAALQAFEQVCRQAEELGVLPDYRLFGPSMVRLALRAGRHDLAETAVAGAARLAQRAEGLASANGIALLCRGLFEDDLAALCAAVEAYRSSPRPQDLASACEAAGALWVRHEWGAQGVALLEEALQIWERLGAARDGARIRHLLRQLGIRRGVQARHARTRIGWESVTPTELKILELLVEGLSNPAIGDRLFISRRTVQTHVSNIFSKLGVASRAELAALAARRLANAATPTT